MTDDDNRKVVFDAADSRDKASAMAQAMGFADDVFFVLKAELSPLSAAGATKMRLIVDRGSKLSVPYHEVFELSVFKGASGAAQAPIAVLWVFFNEDAASSITILDFLNSGDLAAKV